MEPTLILIQETEKNNGGEKAEKQAASATEENTNGSSKLKYTRRIPHTCAPTYLENQH